MIDTQIKDKNLSNLKEWAKPFLEENREGIDYLLEYGSNYEKRLCKKVVELAEEEEG